MPMLLTIFPLRHRGLIHRGNKNMPGISLVLNCPLKGQRRTHLGDVINFFGTLEEKKVKSINSNLDNQGTAFVFPKNLAVFCLWQMVFGFGRIEFYIQGEAPKRKKS